MGKDYIPEQDTAAGRWMNWFAMRLVEAAEEYRVQIDEALEIQAATTAYWDAVTKTGEWTPGVVSRSLTRAKRNARRAAERVVRPMAQRIRLDPKLSDNLKILIGLDPPKPRRGFVGPPTSCPVLRPTPSDSGGPAIMDVVDSDSYRRRRPADAVALHLYEWIVPAETAQSAMPHAGADEHKLWKDARFVGEFTRFPITLPAPNGRPGDKVRYIACWVSRRGEVGPYSHPVELYINFTMTLPLHTARTGAPRVRVA